MLFKIDLKIFLFIILFFFTKQLNTYFLIMLFAILHECGHLILGIVLKRKVKRVYLLPLGWSIEFDENVKCKKVKHNELKNIIIALSGPLTSFILMYLGLKIEDANIKNKIIYFNFMIGIFNLMPIYPLDRW